MSAESGEGGENIVVASFLGAAVLDHEKMQTACDDLYREIVSQSCRKVVLNFGNVQYLNSPALGSLITLNKKLQRMGTPLVICNLDPEVAALFERTKLNRWFTVSERTPEAECGPATS